MASTVPQRPQTVFFARFSYMLVHKFPHFAKYTEI